MKRTLSLALLLALAGTASAAAPDKAVGLTLEKLGYTYEVDEDGDYRMVFETEGERSQLVYVRSAVEEFGAHNVREIWSPGYQSSTDHLPEAVANRLLADSNESKLGGWVKQDRVAMFVVKIDANASPEALSDAVDAAVRGADAIELELTGKDDF